MDYELCKKLKDAGFNSETEFVMVFNNAKKTIECNKMFRNLVNPIVLNDKSSFPVNEILPNPTLSELIEACRQIDYEIELRGIKRGGYIASSMGIKIEGKTPKKAIVNLWLKLNEK